MKLAVNRMQPLANTGLLEGHIWDSVSSHLTYFMQLLLYLVEGAINISGKVCIGS